MQAEMETTQITQHQVLTEEMCGVAGVTVVALQGQSIQMMLELPVLFGAIQRIH